MSASESGGVYTLKGGGRVQGQGLHTGELKVQEGKQGLEEQSGEMQVKLVKLRVRVFPGVWEEEWGTRWCQGGRTGGGVRR